MSGVILGAKLYTDPSMTVPGPLIAERRTWRERLFTMPWRPLIGERFVQTRKPDPKVYRLGRFAFVGHPTTINQLFSNT